MRYLLIPIDHALPAAQAHLARWPDEAAVTSAEELRALADLVSRFVPVADALLAYAQVGGGGVSSRN